jgi:hypothetical protein
MKSGKSNHKDTTQERMKYEGGRMKAEQREEREDVYPQMAQMYADKEILPSSFILPPSYFPWCLCGSFFLLHGERLRFILPDLQPGHSP